MNMQKKTEMMTLGLTMHCHQIDSAATIVEGGKEDKGHQWDAMFE